jgi:hypothetical protein
MTRAEFEEKRAGLFCRTCRGKGDFRIEDKPPSGGKVICNICGCYQFFLAIDRAESHRPALKHGTIEQIWQAWGRHCVCCGLNESEIYALGLERTIQHAPPFSLAGHETNFVPFCSWCQQFSAGQMKRLKALVARLNPTSPDAISVKDQERD